MTFTFAGFAADRVKPIVAGSLGPYGACQADCSEYTGQHVDNMSVEVSSLFFTLLYLLITNRKLYTGFRYFRCLNMLSVCQPCGDVSMVSVV